MAAAQKATKAAVKSAKSFNDIIRGVTKDRFKGIQRNYTVEQVLKLRGSIFIEHTLATLGATRLWELLHTRPYIHCLGAFTGNQAVQMSRAGLEAIYLSGWQVAADANTMGQMYPDQSLYPVDSGPEVCRRLNNAMLRADQIESADGIEGNGEWVRPIVADAEAGFGGSLNCFELMKNYISAGASGVHFEDQLGSEKKCGHMGGKVLIPTAEHIRHLNAARLAADVSGVPTVLVSRTDAESAMLLTSDVDERDEEFIDKAAGRSEEGFFRLKKGSGLQHSIKRSLAYGPFADLLWMETSTPNLEMAKTFSEAIRKEYPDKLLAYNCSPSFNWNAHLSESEIKTFLQELGKMGYKYQFITLAGFHLNNFGTYELARKYKTDNMIAYTRLQKKEFAAQEHGYSAVKHQREVGTSYYDLVANAVSGGHASTTALAESTETVQFDVSVEESSEETEIKLTMGEQEGDRDILTPQALEFLAKLHKKFDARRRELLAKRVVRQAALDNGTDFPDFRPDTWEIRDMNWTVDRVPQDLLDRRVEITGPVDRKMVINALNSGAKVFMADFEDSSTPTWRNLLEGQRNLYDANRRNIHYVDPSSKKEYALVDNPAVQMVRPRGWHLPEYHVLVDGETMSGSLFDFGLYLFHNARYLLDHGTGPYYYLPKLQCAEEAKLWNDVFEFASTELDIPHGSIKCTVLIEHLLASFEMNEILWNLRSHIVGLNCGRWDYIFSYIKTFRNHPEFILPDRFQVNMTSPFMRAYSLLTIQTCHRRGAHAMGGMAAQIPIKNDPEASEKATHLVQVDKIREATDGHDGTWVAHPGLVPLANKVFDQLMTGKNQVQKQLDFHPTNEKMTELPSGSRTEKGLRHNIDVNLGYMEAWLRGTGCVPLYNLMEDAATAEISRAQLWQWAHHGSTLANGQVVNLPYVAHIIEEEMTKLEATATWDHRLHDAAKLLLTLTCEDVMPDFLTNAAYDQIVKEGH